MYSLFLLISSSFFHFPCLIHAFTVSNSNPPADHSSSIRLAPRPRPSNIVDNDMNAGVHVRPSRPPPNSNNQHYSRVVANQQSRAPTIPPPTIVDTSNIAIHNLPCRLPSDFWCDDPNVALACTGGTFAYCEAFKRVNQGKKLDLKLAFESGCPDSQKLIVHRLYHRVLDNPELSEFVDLKAFPWGLARRQFDQNVRCHHGPRECLGNRLLSCALNHLKLDRLQKERILYCFMNHMMARGDPEMGMMECLRKWIWQGKDQAIIGEIMGCAQTNQANQLQMEDEVGTNQILVGRPRFVPYLSMNGISNIHMQAPLQLFLPDKIRHWNRTVTKRFGTMEELSSFKEQQQKQSKLSSSSIPSCEFPPEFWCAADPSITRACFSLELCDQFVRTNFGRPIEIRIIYNSQFEPSRDYLLRFVATKLMNSNSAKFFENIGKIQLELEPAHFTRRALADCGMMGGGGNTTMRTSSRGCARRIIEICIGTIVEMPEERNRLLVCLNSQHYDGGRGESNERRQQKMDQICKDWSMNCFPSAIYRERIMQCANNEPIWLEQNGKLLLKQNHRALRPEPRRTDPWILLNGYSLSTVQNYANLLDQMICLWYRGPGHDREKCGRCDYEPSHC